MNENNNQHYTINDLSALSALSNTYGSITNETMRKELEKRKKSVEAQKKKVKGYKSEFQNNSNSNIDINLELLKLLCIFSLFLSKFIFLMSLELIL